MIPALLSLMALLFFSGLAVLILNYAVYLFENERLNDLTSKIKPNHTGSDVMSKRADRGFTSRDMGENFSKNKAIQPIQFQARGMTPTATAEQSGTWINLVTKFLHNLQHQFWSQLGRTWQNIFQLFKPINEYEKPEESITEIIKSEWNKEAEEEEISDLVEKVISQNEPPAGQTIHANLSSTSSTNSGQTSSSKKRKDLEDDPERKALFEKLENRILNKLKDVGLNHFDLWLELGTLYEKYDQVEKAVEVYTMVLKNSKDKEKDFARDRIIALT